MKHFSNQLLLACLFLLVFGCRTDDTAPDFSVKPVQLEAKYSTVDANEIPEVINALNQAINLNTGNRGTANLGQVSTPFGDVSMEDIFQVIDSLDNRNYTFSVDDLDDDPFTFTNLVVKKRESGSIDPPYLLIYETDSLHREGFKSSGFAMDRFTGLIHKRYLQNFSKPERNTANLGGSYSTSGGDCGYSSRSLNGQGVLGSLNDPGSVNYWNDPTTGSGYLRCELRITRVTYRCRAKSDLAGWNNCYKYVSKRTCNWVGPANNANSGSNCPPPESEEIGINELSLEDYIRSMSLHEDLRMGDPWKIPEHLWRNGLINPMMAGVIDGMLQTIHSAWTIGDFITAWNPFNYSTRAMQIRLATWRFVEFLNQVIDDPQFWNQVWSELKTEFLKYIDESFNSVSGYMYAQGKLLFDVAALFVGAGEINAIMKGTRFSVALAGVFNRLPHALSKAVFDAKNLNRLVEKSGDDLLIKVTKGSGYVARIRGNVMEIVHRGFGGNLHSTPERTTSLVGKSGPLKEIWDNGLASRGKNKGEFNIFRELNGAHPDEVWALNKEWLDNAIRGNDILRTVSDPLNGYNLFNNLDNVPASVFSNPVALSNYLQGLSDSSILGQLSYFGREVKFLSELGYIFDTTRFIFTK